MTSAFAWCASASSTGAKSTSSRINVGDICCAARRKVVLRSWRIGFLSPAWRRQQRQFYTTPKHKIAWRAGALREGSVRCTRGVDEAAEGRAIAFLSLPCMVNNRWLEEITEHHSHVLYWERYAKSIAPTLAAAHRNTSTLGRRRRSEIALRPSIRPSNSRILLRRNCGRGVSCRAVSAAQPHA